MRLFNCIYRYALTLYIAFHVNAQRKFDDVLIAKPVYLISGHALKIKCLTIAAHKQLTNITP